MPPNGSVLQAEFLCEELSEVTALSQPWNRLRAMQAQLEATSKRLTTEMPPILLMEEIPNNHPIMMIIPLVYRGLGYIPGGCLGFLPSTVLMSLVPPIEQDFIVGSQLDSLMLLIPSQPKTMTAWNPKQPFKNGCLVSSNHFLCKDLDSSSNWNNHLMVVWGSRWWIWCKRCQFSDLFFFLEVEASVQRQGLEVRMVEIWRELGHMGVSKNRETPQNGWFIMDNPYLKWMIWGENPLFSGNIHIFLLLQETKMVTRFRLPKICKQ